MAKAPKTWITLVVLLAASVARAAVPTVTVTGSVVTPSGDGVTSGTIELSLSAPGSVLDGSVSKRLPGGKFAQAASKITLSAGGALPGGATVVPNDQIVPTGTYYNVKFTCYTAAAPTIPVVWTEKWQVASAPASVAIGAIPRLDAVSAQALATMYASPGTLGGAKLYVNTTAGLAASAEGEYFLVPSAASDESFVLYREESGAAVEKKRFNLATGDAWVTATGAGVAHTLSDHLRTLPNVAWDAIQVSTLAITKINLVPPAPLPASPAPRMYVEDTASDADRNGNFITVHSNDPLLPRDVLTLTRLGGFKIWDWAAVCPYSSILRCSPGNGAMLAVGSDLSVNGTTMALTTNNFQGAYLSVKGYSATSWDSGVTKLLLKDTNIGGSWDDPAIMIFGAATSSYPALRNGTGANAGVLQVRNGADNGDAFLSANLIVPSGDVASGVADGASNTAITVRSQSTYSTAGAKILKVKNASAEVANITKDGFVQIGIGNTTVCPTCAAGIRGTICYVGAGAGVKDDVQVCAKDAGNTYAWRTIY